MRHRHHHDQGVVDDDYVEVDEEEEGGESNGVKELLRRLKELRSAKLLISPPLPKGLFYSLLLVISTRMKEE